VRFSGTVPGAATLHLADGVALLRPEEQVFTAMLGGFANQRLARNLARSTVEGRENTVKAFAAYVNAFPWQRTSAMVDEWLGDLRSLRDLKRSTIRSYSEAVRAFCHFATDPLYEWASTCEERFGSHPIQVVSASLESWFWITFGAGLTEGHRWCRQRPEVTRRGGRACVGGPDSPGRTSAVSAS
jgi:integrase/recombinase XerC